MYQNTKCRHLIFVYFDFILYSSPLKNSYSLRRLRTGINIGEMANYFFKF